MRAVVIENNENEGGEPSERMLKDQISLVMKDHFCLKPHRSAIPFDKSPRWTNYEVFKFIFNSLFLLPLRLVLLVLLILLAAVFIIPAAVGISRDTSEPVPRWRRWFLQPTRLCARAVLLCYGFWYIPSEWKKCGRNGNQNLARIYVCNHTSPFDILYFYYTRMPAFVANHSVKNIPIIGSAAIALGSIFVDRSQKDSKAATIEAIRTRANDARFPPVIIFPEGTTTNGKVLICFKRGAFDPGVPIQPFVLRYPHRHFNVACTSSHDGNSLVNLLRCLTQFSNSLACTVLPAHIPSASEQSNPQLFAENMRQIMAAEMSVPVTEHSYDDLFLAKSAMRANIPQDFEMSRLRRAFHMDLMGAKRYVGIFSSLDRDQDGLLTEREFCKDLLSVSFPPSPFLLGILLLYSKPGDTLGRLDFMGFLHSVAIFSPLLSDEERLSMVFLVFCGEELMVSRINAPSSALSYPLGIGAREEMTNENRAITPRSPPAVRQLQRSQGQSQSTDGGTIRDSNSSSASLALYSGKLSKASLLGILRHAIATYGLSCRTVEHVALETCINNAGRDKDGLLSLDDFLSIIRTGDNSSHLLRSLRNGSSKLQLLQSQHSDEIASPIKKQGGSMRLLFNGIDILYTLDDGNDEGKHDGDELQQTTEALDHHHRATTENLKSVQARHEFSCTVEPMQLPMRNPDNDNGRFRADEVFPASPGLHFQDINTEHKPDSALL